MSVLYCTMLAQSQTDEERQGIEEKMSSDSELSQYLQALASTDKEDIVSGEVARKQQARQSRVAADLEAMDVDQKQVGIGGMGMGTLCEGGGWTTCQTEPSGCLSRGHGCRLEAGWS